MNCSFVVCSLTFRFKSIINTNLGKYQYQIRRWKTITFENPTTE